MKKMNLLVRITAIAMLALLASSAMVKAANTVAVLGATNRTSLVATQALHINSITIFNNATNTSLFAFFDAPGGTNIHSANAISLGTTNGAYTNYTYALASVTNTYTNIFGFITNDIVTFMQRTTNAVAAGLLSYRLLGIAAVNSNGSQTLTFNTLQENSQGLIVTNLMVPAGGVVINVDYNKRF